jgi:hypothetical protein
MAADYKNGFRAEKSYTPGSPLNFDVPLESGMNTPYIDVLIYGDVVVSVGAANGTLRSELMTGLFSLIEVDSKAKSGSGYKGGKLVRCTPRSLKRMEIFDAGRYQADVANGAGFVGGIATTTIASVVRIPFALPRGLNPFDTSLKHDAYQYVSLKLTCGGRDSLMVGNDRTFALTALKVAVYDSREFNPALKTMELFQIDTQIPVTQASTRFDIDTKLPKNELMYEALLIAETTNAALSDAIVNRVEFFHGTESVYERTNYAIKSEQDKLVKDAAASQVGLYHIPVVTGGRLSTAQVIDKAQLDVSAPGAGVDMLTLFTRTYVPPSVSA